VPVCISQAIDGQQGSLQCEAAIARTAPLAPGQGTLNAFLLPSQPAAAPPPAQQPPTLQSSSRQPPAALPPQQQQQQQEQSRQQQGRPWSGGSGGGGQHAPACGRMVQQQGRRQSGGQQGQLNFAALPRAMPMPVRTYPGTGGGAAGVLGKRKAEDGGAAGPAGRQ